MLSVCAALTHTVLLASGRACGACRTLTSRRQGLSGHHFSMGGSMVHMRAIRAGDGHWLFSWCTCSGAASVTEVLFSNQARADVL